LRHMHTMPQTATPKRKVPAPWHSELAADGDMPEDAPVAAKSATPPMVAARPRPPSRPTEAHEAPEAQKAAALRAR
jgi:hypothetical protein